MGRLLLLVVMLVYNSWSSGKMKTRTKWLSPVVIGENDWFYVGNKFIFIHWEMDTPEGNTCHRIEVPARLLRSGLGIWDAKRVAKKRRKARKATK